MQLYASPGRYEEAAALYLESARLRPADDPQAIECFAMAARLLYYDGQLLRARSTMQMAAERALATGDVVRAANFYIDAAFIALEHRKTDAAWALVQRAEQLSSSPLLEAGERSAIERRIAPSRAVVATAMKH